MHAGLRVSEATPLWVKGQQHTKRSPFEIVTIMSFVNYSAIVRKDLAVSIPVMVSRGSILFQLASLGSGRRDYGLFLSLEMGFGLSASSTSTAACYTCYGCCRSEAGIISLSSHCNTRRLSSSSPDSLHHHLTTGKARPCVGIEVYSAPDEQNLLPS